MRRELTVLRWITGVVAPMVASCAFATEPVDDDAVYVDAFTEKDPVLDAPPTPDDASPTTDLAEPRDAAATPIDAEEADVLVEVDARVELDAPVPGSDATPTDVVTRPDRITPDVPRCPTEQTLCGDRCVNIQTDPAHCGACARPCAMTAHATPACGGGRCGVICDPGYRDCDGDATTGCEVNVATSAAHCGTCGRACAAGQMCVGGTCSSPDYETFERAGTWPWSPWLTGGTVRPAPSTITTGCAHDGAQGLTTGAAGIIWYYRTDRTFGTAGQRLSAWVRATGSTARVYLGFGASAAGAWSFTFALNTRQVVFYNNASWGFTQLGAAAATFTVGAWYRMEVTFGAAGMVTGRIYNAAGAAVATLAQTITGLRVGGVAVTGFGSCVDTIVVQ